MNKELKIKERVMFKKLVIAAIIITGIFIIFAASPSQPAECETIESRDCWTFDNEKGWMYNAPMIDVTPIEDDSNDWSYNDDQGWIYNALTIEVTPDADDEVWAFDENHGWVYQVEEINIVG